MTICKVKVSPKKVKIKYTTGYEDENEYTLSCVEEPVDDFINAILTLAPEVRKHLSLPYDYPLVVTGFTLSHSKEDVGCSITAERLLDSGKVFSINTPNLILHSNSTEPEFSGKVLDIINECCKHATDYINGVRKQQEMFEE